MCHRLGGDMTRQMTRTNQRGISCDKEGGKGDVWKYGVSVSESPLCMMEPGFPVDRSKQLHRHGKQ